MPTSFPRPAAPAISPFLPKQPASEAPGRLGPSPLVVVDLWHLLSLDAPTVAVTWLLFLGVCTGSSPEPHTAPALFLAVWVVYAGDRLLDAAAVNRLPLTVPFPAAPFTAAPSPTDPNAGPNGDLELRHRFHHRHRRAFTIGLAAALVAVGLLLWNLPPRTLFSEALLAVLLAGWLLRVHALQQPGDPRRLPKEFVVGLFFSIAVYLPFATSSAESLSAESLSTESLSPDKLSLLPGAALFAGICTLNCLFLYAWEHPRELSRAHPATAFAVRNLSTLAFLTISLALVAWFPVRSAALGQIPLACSLSTALLLTLHANRHRLPPLRLRALADLVLLTPVLVVLLRHLGSWSGFPARP